MTGIYKITNKQNGLCYIGQSQNIEERWQSHIYHNSPSLIHKMIIELGVSSFTFEVLEECLEKDLDAREIYWISYYDSFNNGYNMTKGGQTGFKYSYEDIYNEYLKTKEVHQTAKNIGCSYNTAHKALLCYGINLIENQLAKPVEQIDPQTLEVIRVYDSLSAAAREMNVDLKTISLAVSGKNKSSCGYYWKEVGSDKQFEAAPIKKYKQTVSQYDKAGNYIASFDSVADAARSLGKDGKNGGSQISAVCNGRKKTAYGFIWKKS